MARKKKKRRARSIFKATGFWISITLSLAVLSLYILSQPGTTLIGSIDVLELIEAKTLDLRFRLRGEKQPGDDIVIIAVDEKTEDDLGRWQSSGRRWIAQMLNSLHEAGAKVIGFDFTLAEPDEGIDLEMLDEIKAQYQEHLPEAISSYPEILTYLDTAKVSHNYDRQLAETIRRAGNVVLGIYHVFDRASAAHLTPEQLETYHQIINRSKYTTIKFPPGITRQPLRLRHSLGVEPNLAIFSEAAKSFGHFTFVPARDGYIRQASLLVEYRKDCYPSLALEVARVYLNPQLPPLIHALGKEGGGSVDSIQLGDIHIPTDGQGRLLINYYGPAQTFPHYSLSDVVLGRSPPETFKDKIVLFGFTGSIYQDVHSIPFQPGLYPGVEVHATIIENILREDFLTKPEWTILADPFIIFLLGIVLGVVLQRTHPFSGAFTALICLVVVAGIIYMAFLFWRVWLNVTFPFMFIVLDYLVMTSYKYFIEEKKEREVRSAFQHYVAPTVVNQLLETVDELKLGGEQRLLTALFADIRGFASISENMKPEDLVQFLNEFFTAMTETVLSYEGTVDKYMGDSILAFYGAPLEQPDHALRACKTAVEMLTRLKKLRLAWKVRDLPPINIGIGINSGEMIVGNMGSAQQFDYTIMGDHVNLASRLQGVNKQYGTSIAISQSTYQLIRSDSFIVRELDTVRVRGRKEAVTIYHLIGYGPPDQQTRAFLNTFHKGLEAYKSRQWGQAMTLFFEVINLRPDDRTCCRMYINRCERCARIPPPKDWDGVFVMESK